MSAGFSWSGYTDTKRLLPRESDPRSFQGQETIDKLGQDGYRFSQVDTVEYMTNRAGYRFIASWNWHRPYERWER